MVDVVEVDVGVVHAMNYSVKEVLSKTTENVSVASDAEEYSSKLTEDLVHEVVVEVNVVVVNTVSGDAVAIAQKALSRQISERVGGLQVGENGVEVVVSGLSLNHVLGRVLVVVVRFNYTVSTFH